MLHKLLILISGVLCMYIAPTQAQMTGTETGTVTVDNDSSELAHPADTEVIIGESRVISAGNEDVPPLPVEATQPTTAPAPAQISDVVQEEVVQLNVFDPDFMASMNECKKNEAINGNRILKIIGKKEDNCRLQYGNYVLNIPMTLLSNIHSFDDVEVVLKNPDLAQYKYLPKYIYDGLMYALDSCSRQADYSGKEEREISAEAFIVRGINAKYTDNTCFIYLENTLKLKFENDRTVDYGFTCSIPQDKLEELVPYFADIAAANPAPEDVRAELPKEVRDADIALMYYLQQNDYCAKNKQPDALEGEN